MEQHVNTLLTVYGEDLTCLRNRIGKDRSKPGEERVFVNMEYRMMAKRILTIMQEIGVTKHITMHCARHSFAVLALTKGMPIESVSRILGHTNITTTQIYAKITIQKLNADMDNFEKQLADLSGVF